MPADDKIFEELSEAQWLWYFYNFLEDQEEDFVQKRDLVEYHASFIEPEAVRKIRESREKAVEVPEDEFLGGITHIFGRALTAPRRQSGKTETVDPTSAISNYKVSQIMGEDVHASERKGKNYKHWLSSELE